MNKAYLDSFGLGMQAAQFGSNQRSKAQGATSQADQIYAGANQAKMQQDTINAQKKAGFNQMLAGAAIGGIMPGVKGILGGAMQGIGGDSPQWLQNFAKPYQDSMNFQQSVQDHMTGLMKYTGDEYQNQSASAVRRYGGGGGGASRMPQMPNFQQWNQQRSPMQFASAFQTMPNWNAPQSSFVGPPTSGYQGAMTKAQRMAELGLPLPASLGGNL